MCSGLVCRAEINNFYLRTFCPSNKLCKPKFKLAIATKYTTSLACIDTSKGFITSQEGVFWLCAYSLNPIANNHGPRHLWFLICSLSKTVKSFLKLQRRCLVINTLSAFITRTSSLCRLTYYNS